jgi:hypothetical protein
LNPNQRRTNEQARKDICLRANARDKGRTIADSVEKSSYSGKGDAKIAAIDPELADLIANWPSQQ